MPKVARCATCTEEHEAPRGAQCVRVLTKLMDTVNTLQREVTSLKSAGSAHKQPQKTSSSSRDSANVGRSQQAASCSDAEDPATLGSLRQDTGLQKTTMQRLQELGLEGEDVSDDDTHPVTKKGKIQSGRTRTAADVARVAVEWPHFHTFRGPGRTAPKYDEMSITEFVHGYVTTILDNGVTSADCRSQLQHLQQLMLDSEDYGWPSVRNAHGVVLQHMEAGKITWADKGSIDDIRRTYCQRYQAAQKPARAKASEYMPRFCLRFQSNKCQHDCDHRLGEDFVRHMCAFCFKRAGEVQAHAEADCRRKKRAKNEQSPTRAGSQ